MKIFLRKLFFANFFIFHFFQLFFELIIFFITAANYFAIRVRVRSIVAALESSNSKFLQNSESGFSPIALLKSRFQFFPNSEKRLVQMRPMIRRPSFGGSIGGFSASFRFFGFAKLNSNGGSKLRLKPVQSRFRSGIRGDFARTVIATATVILTVAVFLRDFSAARELAEEFQRLKFL